MNRIYRREPLDGSLLLNFRSSPRGRYRSVAFQTILNYVSRNPVFHTHALA